MITVKEASFGYGGKPVVSGVSCQFAAGSFTGIVGPNGSGKTTFLRGLLGQLPSLSGSVELESGERFAYVPQAEEMNLFWPLTLRQVAMLGQRSRRALGSLTPEEEKEAAQTLERTGVSAVSDLLLSESSGGQRQRAVLARALLARPTVLLLDEPTRGLDPGGEASLLELIEDLRRERKLTVLLVTHTLSIPLRHAERVLLFHEGRTHWMTTEQLKEPATLARIYGPGASVS